MTVKKYKSRSSYMIRRITASLLCLSLTSAGCASTREGATVAGSVLLGAGLGASIAGTSMLAQSLETDGTLRDAGSAVRTKKTIPLVTVGVGLAFVALGIGNITKAANLDEPYEAKAASKERVDAINKAIREGRRARAAAQKSEPAAPEIPADQDGDPSARPQAHSRSVTLPRLRFGPNSRTGGAPRRDSVGLTRPFV